MSRNEKQSTDRHVSSDAVRLTLLRKAAEQMRRGLFTFEIPVEGSDEVSQLAASLADLAKALETRFREQAKLASITERVNAGFLLEEVMGEIYESFRSVIPYDRIGLALLANDDRVVRAHWVRSDAEEIKLGAGYAAKLEGSSLEEIIRSGKPRILNDLEAYLEDHPSSESTRRIVAEGTRSSLTCPLIALGKPIGFLFFSSREKNTYRHMHQNSFKQLANQVSVVLEKSRLYGELLELNHRLREMQTVLKHEASHDPLTGIWNRRAVLKLLEQELARADRDERPLAAVILDLDRFKPINDEHGHPVGDEVLKELSQRLIDSLRSGEVFGRIGGEEFLGILSPGSLRSAEIVMERARLACAERPFRTAAGDLEITISLGAVVVENPGKAQLSEVMSAADRALYSAKEGGRNRWSIEILS